ncbi:MaoC family dehydratase [Haloarcula nitratireducens]|uniref:MaoC family dehydratase n=1 Tax=Haloarcula nitratireducens TaxID=2487749 RepID=A0AAW4P8F1_9EURY|nr:MaoC family dehydratase [Halomicroarcula nitratireducens]MBX0293810.1 MaoC family dehydratase [Halomicroarcula nitratireducens]
MEYFEDLAVGDSATFGEYEVTREEITTFAGQYDPQPFHTDEDAAEGSMFGDLVASGWHTAAMTMRLLVDHRLSGTGAMGALGVDSLRWPTPVRPGDALSVRTEVVEKEVWDEARGRVATEVTTTTDADETVLSMIGQVLWQRR